MKKNWVELYKKYGIYILLVVVFAFFAVAAPNFLAAKNVINILRQVSMFGIVVVGVCMVMIGGGMDLSVGMQMAVDGMLIGYMMVNLNVPIPLAVIITIVVGCLLGAANGIIAVKMHIAPIIVTLGTMLVLQGVAHHSCTRHHLCSVYHLRRHPDEQDLSGALHLRPWRQQRGRPSGRHQR